MPTEQNYEQRRTIGAKIRYARLSSGKSIEEVAEYMNFRPQTIHNIESGRFSVKLDVAEKMLNYCGYELSVEPLEWTAMRKLSYHDKEALRHLTDVGIQDGYFYRQLSQRLVVICWKISIFAPAKTTMKKALEQIDMWWFAEKLVSLHQQKQRATDWNVYASRCDLLKN